MSDHASDTGLPDLDHTQACHSTNKTSSIDDQDGNNASDETQNTRYTQFNRQWTRAITPISLTFRYPGISLPQSQPGQETTESLHLRSNALVADRDRRTAGEFDSKHDVGFQSPKQEDEDFYDTVSDPSSAPIMASRRRRVGIRTSPAPEGCVCGAPLHSKQDEQDVDSMHTGNGTSSSTQIPPVPANSLHEEPQEVDENYHGPPGSSSQWPHYWKPTVEDESEDTIKCYDSDRRNGAEPATTLPRSRSLSGLEGKLERNKNASSSSLHANVKSIDDFKGCPTAHQAQDVDATSSDSELKYWIQKRQEMLEAIQQVDVWQAQFGQPPGLIASNSLTSRLSEAECMMDMMDRRGFNLTPEWLAEFSGAFELSKRGNTWPLMPFVIAEFGEFFSPNKGPTSENRQSQKQLEIATNKGVIDACQAVKSLMSIGSSRPSDAWCKHYNALTSNAQSRGNVEPLMEFVRLEAQKVSVRNASIRAAKAKELLRQNYKNIDLDESGTQIRSSPKDGPEVGYEDGTKVANSDHPHEQVHHEYERWLTRNYQSETEPFGNRFIYIPNSIHPIVARLDNLETKQPFVMTLSHYFDGFRLLASVSIVALAVKVTPAEKQRPVDTYAEVWLRDSSWCERFDSPFRIQGLSAQGQPFNLDEESIIAMVEAKLGDHFDRTAPEDSEFDGDSESHTSSWSSSSAFETRLRRRDSDQSQSQFSSSVRQAHIHLSPKEAQEMHPNVVAERGMTLVPLQDFPDIPADQHGFALYQLSICEPSSSVFVNCERCHKTLASFDNVDAEPTVARRGENETGDTYIVTSISLLDNIIDLVDKVKRVWLQIGTHRYFMRANETGVKRSHECISMQDKVGVAMGQEEHEAAARYYTEDDEEALAYDTLGDLSPHESRHHAQPPPSEREESPDKRQPDPTPSPSSMQFLPLHLRFPTAELTFVREPRTIISVCEKRGIIHGVYQGVIGYRAIFRGPEERDHRAYLDIRDVFGGYIGRLSRMRHYEVGLMNGKVSTFTAEDEPEERIDPMPLPRQPGQGHRMDLRGGAPTVEDWADTEADSYWSDGEEMSLRGGANVDYSGSDEDDTAGPTKENWLQTGANAVTPESQQAASVSASQPSSGPPKEKWNSTGTTSSALKNQQTASVFASLFNDPPKEDWMPTGTLAQKQTSQEASANASPSDAEHKQRWMPTGVSAEKAKIERKPCTCSSPKSKKPARAPSVTPGASAQSFMINGGTNSNDILQPSRGKETAWDPVHGAAGDVPTHNQQWAGTMAPPSSLKGKEPAKALEDFPVASPHQFVPSNDTPQPRLPQDGSERIPSWLQAGPQSDRYHVEGEEPVYTESYKKWLRDMYTRPSYSTCGTNPDPAPSFQDFWQDREAGRPTTMAGGSFVRPMERPEGEHHGAAVDEGEHIRMESDGYVGENREEANPFYQPLRTNARHFDQIPGRWHGADVDEGEHIRLQEEPPRPEEMTSPNSALQNILNRYLRGRAIYTARAASDATVRED